MNDPAPPSAKITPPAAAGGAPVGAEEHRVPASGAATAGPLRCREIVEADLEAVVDLLCRGFPERTRDYWRDGLARQAARLLPAPYPRYGHVLAAGETVVGVLLTLYTETDFAPARRIRCNLSSWYVEPAYRGYAALLDRVAQRNREVVYTNVTPAPHTWSQHEARGALRYCRGQALGIPALAPRVRGVSIRAVGPGDGLDDLSPAERRLVRDHLSYGCLCFVWRDGGISTPVILQRKGIPLPRGLSRVRVPVAQVIYGGSPASFPRMAGALGRLLLRRHGLALIVVDADSPVPGLPGRYMAERGVKFSQGPAPGPLGDLAYTELVLFGQ